MILSPIIPFLNISHAILGSMSNTQEPKTRPTFVSLYTGAGGLDLGFMAAGFDPVFSNDIFYEATRTYTAMTEMLKERGIAIKEHAVITGSSQVSV